MSHIAFNAERHEYTVDGRAFDSVTQILSGAGLIETEWRSEAAMARGRAVHVATHYLDEDDLDPQWMETSPFAGYVRAWERFKSETQFTPELIEHRVFNAKLGYCGTLDRTGSFAGNPVRALADIKTGPPETWHRIQTAAYAACFEKPAAFRRMTIHLQRDGNYFIKEYHPKDFAETMNVFHAALIINQERKGNHVSSRSDASAA